MHLFYLPHLVHYCAIRILAPYVLQCPYIVMICHYFRTKLSEYKLSLSIYSV